MERKESGDRQAASAAVAMVAAAQTVIAAKPDARRRGLEWWLEGFGAFHAAWRHEALGGDIRGCGPDFWPQLLEGVCLRLSVTIPFRRL